MPLSLLEALKNVYYPQIDELITLLKQYSEQWKDVPMLARTHGQPASPTRLGKEIGVFVYLIFIVALILEFISYFLKNKYLKN